MFKLKKLYLYLSSRRLIKLAGEIGRTKSGKLIKVIYKKRDKYILEVGGTIKAEFSSLEAAKNEAKLIMLKSWLPESKEEKIKELLNSYIEIEYNFTLEWCDRQAEEKPDCDCGCWGYPMEIASYWTWDYKKYKGCPKCGEDI